MVSAGTRLVDRCADMCVDMGEDMCVDMCVDMCIDMCVDVSVDMCVDVCTDTWPPPSRALSAISGPSMDPFLTAFRRMPMANAEGASPQIPEGVAMAITISPKA